MSRGYGRCNAVWFHESTKHQKCENDPWGRNQKQTLYVFLVWCDLVWPVTGRKPWIIGNITGCIYRCTHRLHALTTKLHRVLLWKAEGKIKETNEHALHRTRTPKTGLVYKGCQRQHIKRSGVTLSTGSPAMCRGSCSVDGLDSIQSRVVFCCFFFVCMWKEQPNNSKTYTLSEWFVSGYYC